MECQSHSDSDYKTVQVSSAVEPKNYHQLCEQRPKGRPFPESFQPTSLWIITWVSFFGFIITTPIALLISPEFLNPSQYFEIPVRIWVGIAYLAFFSTVGAYTFYLEGIKRLNASRAAIFLTLVPLFGVIFSAIFLKERFDIFIYPIALLLVILGIILVNRNSSNHKKEKNSIIL